MKKLGMVLGVLTILAFAAFAYGQQGDSSSDSDYDMGPGMMGGYGGGHGGGYDGGYGMMGPGYGRGNTWQKPECRKFYDDTVQLRKQLHDKRFEYMEVARDPKATGAHLAKVDKEIRELQKQLYHKAPLVCRW